MIKKKPQTNKQTRIFIIEKEMRDLFKLPFINQEVVDAYNKLEKEWKILTNYTMRLDSPVQLPKKKIEAIRHKEMLNLKTLPKFY